MCAFFERRIAAITLIARLPDDSAELAMVRFSDGGWGITRDGTPLADCCWSSEHIDACVETFLRMAKIEPRRTDD